MKLAEAIQLIGQVGHSNNTQQIWADLGCGEGLFSRALLEVLPDGSIIHAVDLSGRVFEKYSEAIIFHQANFEKDELDIPIVDGILLANSLHYVKDQLACIKRLKKYLNTNGKFILIEYNTDRANRWVPFPVSFIRAKQIFSAAGFGSIRKIGEHPSVFRKEEIYSAVISK